LFDLQGNDGFRINRLISRLMRKAKAEGGECGKFEKGKNEIGGPKLVG